MSRAARIYLFFFLLPCLTVAQTPEYSRFQWFRTFLGSPEIVQQLDPDSLARELSLADSSRQSLLLQMLAFVHLARYEDPQALENVLQGIRIDQKLGNFNGQLVGKLMLAQIFQRADYPERAADFLKTALPVALSLGELEAIRYVQLELGKTLGATGSPEAAIYLRSALTESLNSGDQLSAGVAALEYGRFLARRNQADSALAYYRQAIEILDAIQAIRPLQETYFLAGDLYATRNNPERAGANFNLVVSLAEQGGDRKILASMYNSLGGLYYKRKEYKKALENLLKAVPLANQTSDYPVLLQTYDLLSLNYQSAGNLAEALEYRNLYVALSDFIQRDRNEREVTARELTGTIDEYDTRISALETKNQLQAEQLLLEGRLNTSLVIIAVLAVIVLLLMLYLYLTKRRTAAALRVSNEIEVKRSQQLAELNATKDKFFSIIGHDLKGPLNSLTAFSSLLINHTDHLSKEEIRALATDLDKSLKNLFALLENLLEWARAQTGAIEIVGQTLDLSKLVRETNALLKNQAQVKGVHLETNLPDDVQVFAHENSIRTVIRNLLGNAIKFTQPGGTVTVYAVVRGDECIVAVRDTGVGMPAEVVAKLFRLDVKHSTPGTAQEKGTGLGLILCADFVQRNGGRIWVESVVNQGTTFYFNLPIHKKEPSRSVFTPTT